MNTRLKMSLAGLSPEKLAAKATNLVEKMTGNANFPTPAPDLADVTAARDTLLQWIEKSQFGDRLAVATRKTQEKVLADLIRGLAHYVSLTAEGDGDVILSAGFDLRRQSTPAFPVGIPVALSAERSPKTGVVELDWKPSKGSVSYVVELTTTDPATPAAQYEFTGITHKSRFTVEGLRPGIYYWFRVKAIGKVSQSAYSDPALVMAA